MSSETRILTLAILLQIKLHRKRRKARQPISEALQVGEPYTVHNHADLAVGAQHPSFSFARSRTRRSV